MAQAKIIGIFDIVLNGKVIATSKPCNPCTSGFRKGLEQLAEKHSVPITKLSWHRKTVRKSRIDYLVEEENRREAQQAQAQA